MITFEKHLGKLFYESFKKYRHRKAKMYSLNFILAYVRFVKKILRFSYKGVRYS